MSRSQRHKVIVQQTDSSGKGLSEKQPAPRYINQYANSQAFSNFTGPSGGPLQGSTIAGFPPTLIPAPGLFEARDAELQGAGDFAEAGQFNLSGNPIHQDLPASNEPSPPDTGSQPTIVSITPASGEVGAETPVTITGVGFTEDSVVQQDGVEITSTWVADDQIDAGVPGSADTAGPVQITVANANGLSNAFAFEVTEAAPPPEEASAEASGERSLPYGSFDLVRIDDVGDKLLFRMDGEVDIKAEDQILVEATGNTTVNGTYTVNTVALTNGQTVVTVDNVDAQLANSIARGRLTVTG